jgi:transposase
MGRRSFAVRDVAEILDHWHSGRSLQAISQSLGLDRKTVRKYVRLAEDAGFAPGDHPPKGGWGVWLAEAHPELNARGRYRPTVEQLDPLREEIRQAIADVTPTTAWRRLRRAGRLTASLATFRRYLARTFPDRGVRAAITVRRPESPPGEEAQVDYGLLGMWLDPLTGRRRAVNAFALVLSMSRHQFACPVLRMDQQAWLDCHIAAFRFFGGVPQRIVPDNLKTGVLKPDLYDPAFNRSYEELAHHYGFLIDPARVRKPTDKPTVERQIPFIRNDFWRGRTFTTFAEIARGLEDWCTEVAGTRIHGTIKERPIEVFQTVEQPELLPLPATPWEPAQWVQAKVARDCLVQVAGAWYTVPHQYVGQQLAVRVTSKLVQCYKDYTLVKTHLRVPKGRRGVDWDDYPPDKAAFFQRSPDWCRTQARRLGLSVGAAVSAILELHALYRLRQAQGVVRLADRYGAERLEAACSRALAFGDPSYRTIKTILERGLDQHQDDRLTQGRLADAFLRGPEELLAPFTSGVSS